VLSVVLILVLAALGLLVTALATGSSLWAWLSIAASLLAAAALFLDWLRRRKRQRKDAAVEAADETDEVAADTDEELADADVAAGTDTGADEPDTETEAPDAETAADDETEAEPEPIPHERTSTVPGDDPHTPPREEDTDVADVLLVSELDDQVMVIDEQPRYHLPECGWLTDKDIIPITVSEARELGFTPCARCGPDATLVARARKKKRSLGRSGRE